MTTASFGDMTMVFDDQSEWLEADGLGGFASGTASGIRTRRYHALLLPATTPPTGRVVLVNGFEAWIETSSGTRALTTQRYAPDVLHPDGASRMCAFRHDLWPTWEFDVDGIRLRQEILVEHGVGTVCVTWTLGSDADVVLRVRPLMSGRDYHAMHHENGAFRFDADVDEGRVLFGGYDGLRVAARSNGDYHHAPEWYRNFLYTAEEERGLDATEDLASPGIFEWRLARRGACANWLLNAAASGPTERVSPRDVEQQANQIRSSERTRRSSFATPLDRAVDAYIVQRGSGRTLVAGYPWFTDWGRDTFIAVRGLCIAAGRLTDARDILVEWAGAVSQGMLPNRFPDSGQAPEFNAVDASLWYVIAASEFLDAARRDPALATGAQREAIQVAILQIVSGYAGGTRFGIHMDADGLLASGEPGVQLTWMDAKVGDRVVTPRIGKPVEIQALWLNALRIAGALEGRWREEFDRGRSAFVERFWNEHGGFLSDVVDVDHHHGTRDDTFRPNQIFAVGGLPIPILDRARSRRLVDAVEHRLLTPMGLRSLAADEPGYAARYEGGPESRDARYHQGTVWPWLIGAFVEAWVRVRGNTAAARREARERFLMPLQEHLDEAGLGHISEIADAEAPFTPRGCPFQAWSLGEFVRLDRVVLADRAAGSRRRRERAVAV